MTKWATLLVSAPKHLKITWHLLKDDRVPMWQKAIPFLPLLYILSPFNFLSFFVPIDDFMLIALAMELLERTVDEDILADYKPQK